MELGTYWQAGQVLAANTALLNEMDLTTATNNPDVDGLDDAAERPSQPMQALDPNTDCKTLCD